MLCVSSTRSDIYKHALIARDELNEVLRGVRDKQKQRLQSIEVFDTRTLFSGQAIVAYSANNILQYKPGLTVDALIAGCRKLSAGIKTFILLKDLYYAKNHAKLRNDKSVSSIDYAIAPVIMVSYAGSLERLFKKRAYKEFVEFAENNEITLHVSVMSVTGGIYAGPGAVSMAYCMQDSAA